MNLTRSQRFTIVTWATLALFTAGVSLADQSKLPSIITSHAVVVETGQSPRVDSPVSLELRLLDAKMDPVSGESIRLIETTDGKEWTIPSQVEASKPARLWWIVDGIIPPNSKRTYRVEVGVTKDDKELLTPAVEVHRQPDSVEFRIGTSPVLRYNWAHIEVTETVDPRYGRSAYIHPAWTPKGTIVTDQFPPDHAHQSGIFLANVKTEFEGRTPDFWNLLGETGRVRFKQFKSLSQGPVFGDLAVEHEHVDLSAPGGKVALLETWLIRVWNLPALKPAFWVFDIASTITCATSSPVRLKEYHYGGMALRGAREWTPAHCRFVTSEGKDRIEGNHTRPRWCDLNGNVHGQLAGITFMTQAQNFGYPEPLRIHPKMPYMVYSPAVLGDRDLVPDRPVVSKYRFLIHDGEIPPSVADRLQEDFSAPLVAVPVVSTAAGQ